MHCPEWHCMQELTGTLASVFAIQMTVAQFIEVALTRSPRTESQNLKPETRNPKPETRNSSDPDDLRPVH